MRPVRPLATLAAELIPADAGTPAAPRAVRLLPMGHFRSADGSGRPADQPNGWLLDHEAAAALIQAAAARASDYVIDYEHQTLNAADNGQPAPAAGWFRQLEARADGLYAVDVRWTPRAAALIEAKEYRYLSPVFTYDGETGRVLALGPAALTNNPGLDGLTDLSLSALSAVALSALAGYFTHPNPPEEPMKELLKALGLAETASEAQALAALQARSEAHGRELAAMTAKATATPDPAKYVEVAVLSAVQTELNTLKAAAQANEVDALVQAALTAGKLLPATEAWARELGAKDLAALKSFIEAQPAIAALAGTQTGGTAPAKPGTPTASADEVAVMKVLGLTPDQYQLGKKE